MCCEGSSSYEVTTLLRAACGLHQGVRPTTHSQGTFGYRGRRVGPLRGVALYSRMSSWKACLSRSTSQHMRRVPWGTLPRDLRFLP